ncbi:hypothetical protein DESC_40110 [Desulfosarcina cetonica]|uniref:hypothetical protein n=1 Tax=Desulfosarcina cetonica TaxID=90730 RepID=UPI0006D2A7B2|nr:hypothetical protein [Desulfosarcina cetonica]VTR66079.1 hypothetical protein DESC_40110 [Desulfosarcina cetonica]
MDDLFDDCDDSMDDGFDDHLDDGTLDKDGPAESGDGCWDGPEWQDWMIIGPISEEIAREKREKERIRKSFDKKDNGN